MTFTDCQRAKCGAKNIFMTHICLKRLNYFSAAVEDEPQHIVIFTPIFFLFASVGSAGEAVRGTDGGGHHWAPGEK